MKKDGIQTRKRKPKSTNKEKTASKYPDYFTSCIPGRVVNAHKFGDSRDYEQCRMVWLNQMKSWMIDRDYPMCCKLDDYKRDKGKEEVR